jgi:hypothetical protein
MKPFGSPLRSREDYGVEEKFDISVKGRVRRESMDRIMLARRLMEVAKDMTALTPQFAASELRNVCIAQDIVDSRLGGVKTQRLADARITIDKMPGFSPMQLRQQINKIVDVRHRISTIRMQFESTLKELEGLEADEKVGITKLKKAAEAMKDKEKFLVQAEKGMLQFTAFVQRKRPGIEQMLADPSNEKFGDKAGDFFGRVGAKLGQKVEAAIKKIYDETAEDLTHVADCVTGLTVIENTEVVKEKAAALRMAGLLDAYNAMKQWLSGKTNSLASRLVNFAGDIGRFVRGFEDRTNRVKDSVDELQSIFDDAESELEGLMRTA